MFSEKLSHQQPHPLHLTEPKPAPSYAQNAAANSVKEGSHFRQRFQHSRYYYALGIAYIAALNIALFAGLQPSETSTTPLLRQIERNTVVSTPTQIDERIYTYRNLNE